MSTAMNTVGGGLRPIGQGRRQWQLYPRPTAWEAAQGVPLMSPLPHVTSPAPASGKFEEGFWPGGRQQENWRVQRTKPPRKEKEAGEANGPSPIESREKPMRPTGLSLLQRR